MHIASLNSRMLMQGSSRAQKLLRAKKTGTGCAKTVFNHNHTLLITKKTFANLNSQARAINNGVDTNINVVHTNQSTPHVQKVELDYTKYLRVYSYFFSMESFDYKHDVIRPPNARCAHASDWIRGCTYLASSSELIS